MDNNNNNDDKDKPVAFLVLRAYDYDSTSVIGCQPSYDKARAVADDAMALGSGDQIAIATLQYGAAITYELKAVTKTLISWRSRCSEPPNSITNDAERTIWFCDHQNDPIIWEISFEVCKHQIDKHDCEICQAHDVTAADDERSM